MHSSLTIRTNILLLALYGALLAACAIAEPSSQLVLLAPFAGGGFLAGSLQARAVCASPAQFRNAESWSAVRTAFAASPQGKLSLSLLWLNGLAILCLLIFANHLVKLPILLGAYASFGAARELGTFRSVRVLKDQPAVSGKNGA